MRVFTTGSTMPGQQDWLDDERTFAAWAMAAERNIPVALQMTAKGIPQVINLLKRFPKLRVVLDHMARPAQADGPPYLEDEPLWSLAAFDGVYLKLTERNFVGASKGKATPESFFQKTVSEFGSERMAWGSNFPASERSLPELVKLAQETLALGILARQVWLQRFERQGHAGGAVGHFVDVAHAARGQEADDPIATVDDVARDEARREQARRAVVRRSGGHTLGDS